MLPATRRGGVLGRRVATPIRPSRLSLRDSQAYQIPRPLRSDPAHQRPTERTRNGNDDSLRLGGSLPPGDPLPRHVACVSVRGTPPQIPRSRREQATHSSERRRTNETRKSESATARRCTSTSRASPSARRQRLPGTALSRLRVGKFDQRAPTGDGRTVKTNERGLPRASLQSRASPRLGPDRPPHRVGRSSKVPHFTRSVERRRRSIASLDGNEAK